MRAASGRATSKNLLGLVAVDSVDRSLEEEDAAADRERRYNENQIYGAPMPSSQPQQQASRTLIAGNNSTHHHYPQPQLPSPPAADKKSNGLLKYGAIALTGGSLALGGVLLNDYLNKPGPKPPPPQKVEQKPHVDKDTIGVLEPDRE